MPGRFRSGTRSNTRQRAWLALIAAVIAASCGDDGITDPPVEPVPRPIVGGNVPVSATIDTAGGSIVAVGTDGTRYTLTVPRHALPGPVTITVTPLEDFDGLPLSGRTVAASFEPDGLGFRRPVELEIVSPAMKTPRTVGLRHSGDDVNLMPAFVSGDTARLQLMHFSSNGVGSGTESEVAAMAAEGASTASALAEQVIAAELARAGAALDHPDPELLAAAMREWYEEGVAPALDDADDTTIDAALAEWFHWLTLIQLLGVESLDDEVAAAETAAAHALLTEIDRLNEFCSANDDTSVLPDIGRHVAFAEAAGLVRVAPELAIEAVVERLCVQVVIAEAEVVETGEDTRTLRVRAGMSVGGSEPSFDTPLDIDLTPTLAYVTPMSGTTDSEGRFSAQVQLSGGDADASVLVEVSHPELGLLSATKRVPVGPPSVEVVWVTATYQLSGSVWDDDHQDYGGVSAYGTQPDLQIDTTVTLSAGTSTADGSIRHLSWIEGPSPEHILRLHVEGDIDGTARVAGGVTPQSSMSGLSAVQTLLHVHRRVYYRIEATGESRPQSEQHDDDERIGIHVHAGEPTGVPNWIVRHPWQADETDVNVEGWLEPGTYLVIMGTGLQIVANEGTQTGRARVNATLTLLPEEPQ